MAADGTASDPLEFVPLPGSGPTRVPGVWPQWIGAIAGVAPLQRAPGVKVRANCRGVGFAEIRELRLLPARDEDLISTSLTSPRERHLFRPGEAMPLVWMVRSFLPAPVVLAATLRLESPYGQTPAEQPLRAALPPGGQVAVPATNRRCEGRSPTGGETIAVRSSAGWQAEIFIPWSKPAGSLVGLDLAIDDDDSGKGRKSQIVWHGTSQNYQDPSVYGRFAWP